MHRELHFCCERVCLAPYTFVKMSRFWAAASSSEGEQGSDSDSYDEAQPTQKLAEKKFGATFEESDSGE